MKKRLVLLLVAVVATMTAMAQVPQTFTYQAVVRDANGRLISNGNVGIKVSILQGSETGAVVYQDEQTARTNANGLFTIEIGNEQNSIAAIDWAGGPYFLKSEVDPTGGSNYVMSTVQQMLSVPYALRAHMVDSIIGGVNVTETQTLADVATLGNEVGRQIKQLSDPSDSMDAVNLRTLYAVIHDWRYTLDSIIGVQNSIIDSLQDILSNMVSSAHGDTVAVACDFFTWYGNSYTATGNYTHTFSVAGVDSIVTLHLTINNSTLGDTIAIADGSFSWYGTTYTESIDTATHVLTNALGCDSIVTLHLTINSLTIGFDANGASYSTFSVADGRSVRFSKGNLQFSYPGTHEVAGGDTETGIFRFAENQYDYIGDANINIYVIESYSGWIDLFGFGTSGWGYHSTTSNIHRPWCTMEYNDDYYPHMLGDNANADWGVYNAISNGGNQPGLWRTLTHQEWRYLLDSRNISYRYVKATINDVNGLIVFPDNFAVPSELVINGANSVSTSYNANHFNVEQWALLQSSGCIFLPAAGLRRSDADGGSTGIGTRGLYHGAGNPNNSTSEPYGISFNNSNLQYYPTPRRFGQSVRLVQDVN